jgi:hypothetical protein
MQHHAQQIVRRWPTQKLFSSFFYIVYVSFLSHDFKKKIHDFMKKIVV